MSTSLPYLNPVELFGLTDSPDLSFAALRKAKKRFLTEMEVDGKEDFDYHGQLFTRNDLDRVIEEAADEGMFTAYVAAANIPKLSAFLTSGQISKSLNGKQLASPRLTPLLKSYFAPAFNQAYGRAVASEDLPVIKKMNNWATDLTGIRDAELYEAAYRLLDGRADKAYYVVNAYLRNAASPDARSFKGMKVFHENFPAATVGQLPVYFKDITNKLTGQLIPSIITLNNDHQNPRMALALANRLLALPHLTEANSTELKKISAQLRKNRTVQSQNRQQQSPGSEMDGVRIAVLIIVACLMMARFISCNNSSSSPRLNTYQEFRYTPPSQPWQISQETYQRRFATKLRSLTRAGSDLDTLSPHRRANIPMAILSPLRKPGAGVYAANHVLNDLYMDTLYHLHGHLLTRPTEAFDPEATFRELMGRKARRRDRDTSQLYQSLQGINKKLIARNKAALTQEQELKTERKKAIAKGGKKVIRPISSYGKKDKNDLLGPQAGFPKNYYLYQQNNEPDDGRLMTVKVGIDEAGVGALLIWRDTLGLRQLRVPGALSAPLTFNVGRGKVHKLLDGYIVYGKQWSDRRESPFGNKGWFKEVLCYCGPNDHKAFTNGKKSYRKNLWLPFKKVDTSKSMSPQAFIRGAKRLK
jgi:hypothetical protein